MRSAAEIIDELVAEVIPDDATPDLLWRREREFAALVPTLPEYSPAREIARTLARRLDARRCWLAALEFLR